MFRFQTRTLMLLIVIAALVIALIAKTRSAARREAELLAEQREVTLELLSDSMSLQRDRLVDKRREVQRLTQDREQGRGDDPSLQQAQGDLREVEQAVTSSTKRIDDFLRDGKIILPAKKVRGRTQP